MTNIELFELICNKLQRRFAKALQIGTRNSFLLIASPLRPFNLSAIYTEFDSMPKTSPRINKFIELTESLINQWNQTIIQLQIDPAPLCFSIDENSNVSVVSNNADFAAWEDETSPAVFTWDKVMYLLSEVNGYLKKMTGKPSAKDSTSAKSNAGRPGAELKPPEQYIKTEIPGFNTKFVELLKSEFYASKSREIALMFLALIKMGHLNEPANLKELLLSFVDYFGSKVNYTQFAKDFKSQSDTEIVSMEKRIGNIKNKNGIK